MYGLSENSALGLVDRFWADDKRAFLGVIAIVFFDGLITAYPYSLWS